MPSLSQSPLLQALGYAIANSLWQMAMVWIVYVLLTSVFKFKSETKYRVAVGAQVIGFAWFLVTLQFYYRQCSEALRIAKAVYLEHGDTVFVASNSGTFRSSMLSFFIKLEQVLPYLSVAYLVLLLVLTVRWFRAYRYTQLVRLNGLHKIDVDWKLFVIKVAEQLGIKQKVRIYLSEIVKSPVTIGFLKPVILIPVASIIHLSLQQLEAVILHELAHIKRHDYLLNIVLSIVELSLFFNPFTRLITKSISKERENSCDDWVLQYQYNPSMYAEALLRIAVLQKTPSMAMHAVKAKGELLSRVQRMVHQKDRRFNYRHQLLALLLMTGILTSLAWFDPSAMKSSEAKTSTAEAQAVVLEPLASKVDNPLFNPMFFLNEPLKEEVKKTVDRESKRELARLKREYRTAEREINLPTIAPVVIENLQDIEKNIVSINKQMKKMLTAKGGTNQWTAYYNNVNFFDSVKSPGFGYAFNMPDKVVNWQALAEQIKSSQKQLETVFKKSKPTDAYEKKAQAELDKANKTLAKKLNNMPTLHAFVADGQTFFKTFELAELDTDQKLVDRTRIQQRELRTSTSKLKLMTDSMQHRVNGRLLAKAKGGQLPQGYVALPEDAPYLVVDNMVTTYSTTVAPKLPTGVAYGYVYSQQDQEAQETATAGTKTKTSCGGNTKTVNATIKTCPKVRSVCKDGKTYTVVVPAATKDEQIIIEIQ
jgi:beta-lactamase regulating signal transducer with metallopeptidase domain